MTTLTRRQALAGGVAAAAIATHRVSAQTPITLDFPSWQAEEPGMSNWWRAMNAAFEASHPGVRVNLTSIPFASYIQQLTVRFAGNNPPDIVHLPTRNFAAFASQGWLAPLDERLARTDVLANWTPLQSDMRWDNKIQGILLMGYGSLLYYNATLLQRAGLAAPTTPQEWLTAIERTTIRDQGQFGLVATSIEHPNLVVEAGTWVMGQGADWVQNGRYAMSDARLIAAVDQYRQSMRFAPPGANSNVVRQLFLDGKATFLRDGPWVWAAILGTPEAVRSQFRAVRLPFPHVTGGTSNSLHMPANIAANKRELVWEYMLQATRPEWQTRYTEMSASPAPRRGAVTAELVQRLPHLQLVNASAAEAVSVFPSLPALQEGYNEYATIFGRAMMRLISTQEPTAAVLAGLERDLTRALPLR